MDLRKRYGSVLAVDLINKVNPRKSNCQKIHYLFVFFSPSTISLLIDSVCTYWHFYV